MRDYAKISPRFWTGETGRKLRALGRDEQIVALYLLSCPSANMIGLYYLSLPTLAHETGIPLEGASKALQRVCETGFSSFEGVSETIFVFEMARMQIGEYLKSSDNLVKHVWREAEIYRKSGLYKLFVKKYGKAFCATPDILSEAPSKPLRSHEQERERERENEQDREREDNAAIAAPPPGKKPKPAATDHANFISHFTGEWQRRHGTKYPFRKHDGAQAATVLKECGSLDSAKAAVDRYFANTEKFFQGHPFGLFVSQLPRFLVAAQEAPDPLGEPEITPQARAFLEADQLRNRQRIGIPEADWQRADVPTRNAMIEEYRAKHAGKNGNGKI